MMPEIITAVCALQCAGERGALVTIVSTQGSTPRKAGAQMLVHADGRTIGTIGGGCAEAECRMQALHALDLGRSALYCVSMLNDAAAVEGMVCGGIMEVFVQVI